MHLTVTFSKHFYILLLLALTGTAIHAQIPDSLFPKQPDQQRLVNDFTGTLNASESRWLEDKLVAYDKASSNQVSIVIVNSIAGNDIAEYATELGRRWGIGQKEKNNGVLITLAMQSHDVNISPGYGLEKVLPDVLCKQIIQNEMVPLFKQGYFYDGLDKATTVIISVTKGEFKAEAVYGAKKGQMPRWLIILLLIVGINGFFLLVIPALVRLYYFLIGKKPPKRKHRDWTISTTEVSDIKSDYKNDNSGNSSSNDFGGYGGGSFGGGGASGKW